MEDSPVIKITFPFEPGVIYDNEERLAFWDSPNTIEWFRVRGYTLYKRFWEGPQKTDMSVPIYPPDVRYAKAEYPYASYDTVTNDSPESSEAPLRAREERGKVVFAHDSLKRHVAIKLVRDDTAEYRILRYLSEQSIDVMKDSCVIPVLDLLPIKGFWFAVMPRWGSYIDYPKPKHLFEVVDIIHGLLKGLRFLHDHNIAHGDICISNALVSHFSDMSWPQRTLRPELRLSRSLSFALFDFDFSVMVPAGVDKKDFRLPYHRSWGSFNVIHDTAAGQYDYSPFVFDVGAMGVALCRYQHLSKDLPLLAPLLDMMTTWDLQRRFTASEALQFFEDRLSEVPETSLRVTVQPDADFRYPYDECDRWQTLFPEFVEKWKVYKVPPVPWCMRLMRFIHRNSWNGHIVPSVRLFFIRLASILRKIYSYVLPSKYIP